MTDAHAPLLIHIGYHKTATTWLQQKVFSNADLGFSCPWGTQAAIAVDLFIHTNPFRFDPVSTRRSLIKGMQRAQSSGLLAVLSNEALCGDPFLKSVPLYCHDVAQRLYMTLPQARILITIREQRACILSHYRQEIAVGGYESLPEYIGAKKLPVGWFPTFRLDHLEYDLIVAHYQRLFGREQVLVLPMELLKRDPSLYLNRLYAFAGVSPKESPDMTSDNVGYRGLPLLFRKYCNAWNIGKPDWSRGRPPLSWKIAHRFEYLLNAVVPELFHERIERHLQAALPESLATHYAKSNQELHNLTGLDLSGMGYPVPSEPNST